MAFLPVVCLIWRVGPIKHSHQGQLHICRNWSTRRSWKGLFQSCLKRCFTSLNARICVFSASEEQLRGKKERKEVLILLLVWLWIKQTLLQVSEVLVNALHSLWCFWMCWQGAKFVLLPLINEVNNILRLFPPKKWENNLLKSCQSTSAVLSCFWWEYWWWRYVVDSECQKDVSKMLS